jgi:hypothetical protein
MRVRHPDSAIYLLPLLVSVAALPVAAYGGTREAVADAMSRMMEAMGLFDSGPNRGYPGGPSWAPPVGSFTMPGSIPRNAPYQASPRGLDMGEAMRQFSRGMASAGRGAGMRWTASPLEGIWEGRDGELLIVQGNRFRIYAPSAAHVDGYLMVRADRVALYNPDESNTRVYEYAESQGRLALRDASGQLLLYRRLRLDQDDGAQDSSAAGR